MAVKERKIARAAAPAELPEGWRVVRFDEMAQLVNDRVDDPSEAGVERYVGLEHLDPESLKIRRWGSPEDVEAQKLRFQPGDIIFGKRRAYQRKLAVADFEGICSAHAMVLRAREETVVKDFLPFFMQSDTFFERALSISVGSLSPTINWKTLAGQEFAIPPKKEQLRIAEAFRAVDEVVDQYENVSSELKATHQQVVDKLFSNKWKEVKLAEVTTKIVDGVHKRPNYASSGIPFITVENLTSSEGIDFSNTRYVTEEDHREFKKRANPEKGDVLVSKDGTLGVARLVETDIEFSIFVSVALLKPAPSLLDGRFLRAYFETSLFKKNVLKKVSGSALKHIHLVDFRNAAIPLPSLKEQREIASIIEQADSMLVAVSSHKERNKQLKQALVNELLPYK